MRINHLSLTNFRNYARLELTTPPGAVVLYGNNAQGKTSLLEAIYYLATSRSPYTNSDRQLINWLVDGDTLPHARLVAEIATLQGLKRLEVTLLKERNGRLETFRKEIRVNGLPRRVVELLGQIRVVLFLPQDMTLIEGPPGARRRYLDITLCQTDHAYCHALGQYNKVLTQRNALLRRFQEQGRTDTGQLAFWDEQLAEHGARVIVGRHGLVRDLERRAQAIHSELTGHDEHLRLRYQPGFDPTPTPEGQLAFAVGDLGASALPELPRKEIVVRFRETLERLRAEERTRGMTLIGPQRDEMRFLVNGHDLGLYGSRGQGRTAVLALKLAELAWMREQTGEWPILLLDEVVAELDMQRRAYLLERIQGAEQVLLTTTEPHLFTEAFLQQVTLWRVEAGNIHPAP